MNEIVYLDNNSTTHLLPSVTKVLQNAIETSLGNPESLDLLGEKARESLEKCRSTVALLIEANPEQIIFTSSGSESNAIAIYSAIHNTQRKKIVCSQLEHASVNKTLELFSIKGYEIKTIKTLPTGIIDLDHAESLIDDQTALVSLQLANNETGVIQPVSEISQLSKKHNTYFHCDGAQGFGKMHFKVNELGCDYFTFTGHKIHGPKGVGGFWFRGNKDEIFPLIPGGSQELGKRGGTHNLLGIIGLGTAAKERQRNFSRTLNYTRHLRDTFEKTLFESGLPIVINGGESPRIANTSNIQFKEVDGKALFLRLLQQNIICSQTSACTSQYPEPSKTLRAMGLTYDEAFNSIRFSFSEINTPQEVIIATNVIIEIYNKVKTKLGLGW